jgi:arylsulfatase
MNKNAYVMAEGIKRASEFLETFAAYPPSQEPASFTVTGLQKGIDAANKAKMTSPNH